MRCYHPRKSRADVSRRAGFGLRATCRVVTSIIGRAGEAHRGRRVQHGARWAAAEAAAKKDGAK